MVEYCLLQPVCFREQKTNVKKQIRKQKIIIKKIMNQHMRRKSFISAQQVFTKEDTVDYILHKNQTEYEMQKNMK